MEFTCVPMPELRARASTAVAPTTKMKCSSALASNRVWLCDPTLSSRNPQHCTINKHSCKVKPAGQPAHVPAVQAAILLQCAAAEDRYLKRHRHSFTGVIMPSTKHTGVAETLLCKPQSTPWCKAAVAHKCQATEAAAAAVLRETAAR
jgi:hypothetical protein